MVESLDVGLYWIGQIAVAVMSAAGVLEAGGAVRLLQAATPFGATTAAATSAGATAQAVAASRCYLLSADGTLREVTVGTTGA